MPLKALFPTKSISRWVVLSAVALLLVFKYAVRHPLSDTAVPARAGPDTVPLGPSHLPFTPCWLAGSREQVLCGWYRVYENRQSRTGRQIALRVAVLPALKSHAAPSALFVLAGGPGQAATALGTVIEVALKKVRQDRDIVLIDQRGTGQSNPLKCPIAADALPFSVASQSFAEAAQSCLATLDADPRFYSSFDFADDLDDVRGALGYSTIDIWGASYGTRAALVYMKTHPGRVRSAVLDGVAPYSNKIPLYEARDSQRALDSVLANCDRDENCHAAFPDVRQRLADVLATLQNHPIQVTIRDPLTDASTEIVVTRANFATSLRALLYTASFDRMVPLVIRDASDGDFEPLVAMTEEIARAAGDNVSRGLMLSVLCSEDVARITPQEMDQATRGTFLGDVMVKAFADACSHWPRTFVPPGFDAPIDALIPTLLLSGKLDPVTPPEWAQQTALHLPNNIQVVVPDAAHGVSSYGCVPDVIASFVRSGTVAGIDTACAATRLTPSFVTSPAGMMP